MPRKGRRRGGMGGEGTPDTTVRLHEGPGSYDPLYGHQFQHITPAYFGKTSWAELIPQTMDPVYARQFLDFLLDADQAETNTPGTLQTAWWRTQMAAWYNTAASHVVAGATPPDQQLDPNELGGGTYPGKEPDKHGMAYDKAAVMQWWNGIRVTLPAGVKGMIDQKLGYASGHDATDQVFWGSVQNVIHDYISALQSGNPQRRNDASAAMQQFQWADVGTGMGGPGGGSSDVVGTGKPGTGAGPDVVTPPTPVDTSDQQIDAIASSMTFLSGFTAQWLSDEDIYQVKRAIATAMFRSGGTADATTLSLKFAAENMLRALDRALYLSDWQGATRIATSLQGFAPSYYGNPAAWVESAKQSKQQKTQYGYKTLGNGPNMEGYGFAADGTVHHYQNGSDLGLVGMDNLPVQYHNQAYWDAANKVWVAAGRTYTPPPPAAPPPVAPPWGVPDPNAKYGHPGWMFGGPFGEDRDYYGQPVDDTMTAQYGSDGTWLPVTERFINGFWYLKLRSGKIIKAPGPPPVTPPPPSGPPAMRSAPNPNVTSDTTTLTGAAPGTTTLTGAASQPAITVSGPIVPTRQYDYAQASLTGNYNNNPANYLNRFSKKFQSPTLRGLY